MSTLELTIETMNRIAEIEKKGYSIKTHHSGEFGADQLYRATIYTRKRIIRNLYTN